MSPDPVVARLDHLLVEMADWVRHCLEGLDEVADGHRVDRIARLEQLRAATAAVQAAECVRFAQSQVEAQLAAGVHPRRMGRGIGDQIGLACHVSPHTGSRRLATARALWFDLPHTYALLTAGKISERVAEIVVAETRHLNRQTRRVVDADITQAEIGSLGVRQAEALARRIAYQADRHAYVARGKTERANRCVTVRPAPDTMSYLTGFLPVEQGVACYAALKQATDTAVAAGDPRSRGQIMADTFVVRLTGQSTADDVDVEVHLTMPLAGLLDPDNHTPATLAGHGPVPADLARHLIHTTQGRVWWRRLFTAPTGHIVGGDPTRRRYTGWLAQLITLRDQTCRDPYCDAPIRHLDHIRPYRDNGPTTLTNGRGVCARGNHVRDMPGWHIDTIHPGTGQESQPHTTITRTPTGHTYQSRAPDPP